MRKAPPSTLAGPQVFHRLGNCGGSVPTLRPPEPAAGPPRARSTSSAAAKATGRKIVMVTSYDAWSSRLLADTPVDCLLVGDSAMMVVHGEKDTLGATPELMAMHTRAVARGAPGKFIVADMPFLATRKGEVPCARLRRASAARRRPRREGRGGKGSPERDPPSGRVGHTRHGPPRADARSGCAASAGSRCRRGTTEAARLLQGGRRRPRGGGRVRPSSWNASRRPWRPR